MRRALAVPGAILALLQVAAAPGGGVFAGRWKTPNGEEATITVSYRPEKRGQGRMSLQLGEAGERFAGEYLRLDGKRTAKQLEPHLLSWNSDDFDEHRVGPRGRPWPGSALSLDRFRSRYSGAVIATLAGSRGATMRCSFDLVEPERGLPGGAEGACQSTEGDVVTVGGGRAEP